MLKAPGLTVLFILCFFYSANAQKPLWGRGNTGGGMDSWAVATDPSGNVFGAGFMFSYKDVHFGSVTIPSSSLFYQPVMVKYDANGNVLWARSPTRGDAYVLAIAADNNGNSFMLGQVSSATLAFGTTTVTNATYPNSQYFIVKFDPAGNVVWMRTAGGASGYLSTSVTTVLGAGGITTDAAGNVYITSNFKAATVTVGPHILTNADATGNTYDMLIAMYDPSGNVVWAKSAGGTKDDEAFGITVTPAGSVYIAGVFGSPTLSFGASVLTNTSTIQQAYIARYDASGNAVWGAGSGGSIGVDAVGIASDAGNNVYLTGGFKDNTIMFNTRVITNTTPGISSLYLVKFKPTNAIDWLKTIYTEGSGPEQGVWGYSIAMSKCGVIWVSGVMHDSVNIDGHILTFPPGSPDPIFIAGYQVDGTYAGSLAIQSGGDDQSGIACDASGNIFLCSDYIPTYPFFAGNDILPADPEASELMYVLKYPYINVNMDAFKHSGHTLCLNGGITLGAPSGYSNYLWQDGSQGTGFDVKDTGVFWVYSYDSCASSQADTFHIVNGCDCGDALFVPNAFTPNGDGQDDVFYPRCGAGITEVTAFRVYNRWGELMFERNHTSPNDKTCAWDGTFKGNTPLPDVYVWVCDIVCTNGNVINKKGSITVIR